MSTRVHMCAQLIACALLLIAFNPHHHAMDSGDSGHCAACVSLHNSLNSLPSTGPVLITDPVVTTLAPSVDGKAFYVDVALSSEPRAPPF